MWAQLGSNQLPPDYESGYSKICLIKHNVEHNAINILESKVDIINQAI